MLCHLVAVLVGGGILFPATWMLFDRRDVISIANAQINPDPVVLGQKMWLTWDAIEYRNCEGMVQRQIVDSANRIFYFATQNTIYHEATNRETQKFSTAPIVVPTALHVDQGKTSGSGTYVSYVTRWCNWMQKHFWPMREPPIRVDFNFVVPPLASTRFHGG